MSTQVISKKRKSGDAAVAAVKKAKIVKSADRPAPLKSALKKNTVKPANTTKEKTKKPGKGNQITEEGVQKSNVDGQAEADEQENGDGGAELTADQTAALLAGFSSSEDEDDGEDENGIAISSLPKAPTTGDIQKRIKNAVAEQDDPENTPGVIYVGRIPHGFYEHQMRAYFSQFGEILHLRLARNKKTGASQHYAFIEFASAAVADIVAKTMDKYLLFGHLLHVRRIPKEQVKDGIWNRSDRRSRRPAPRNSMERRQLKQGATREQWENRIEKEKKRRADKAEKLKEMGYEFNMPDVKAVSDVPVKSKALEDVVAGAEPGDVPEPQKGEDTGAAMVEDVQTVESEPGTVKVSEVKVRKKRPASGKTEVRKAIKKVKA